MNDPGLVGRNCPLITVQFVLIAFLVVITSCGKPPSVPQQVECVTSATGVDTPIGKIYILYVEYVGVNRRGPMILHNSSARNPVPQLFRKDDKWFVGTPSKDLEVPEGSVVFYDTNTCGLNVLAAEWDPEFARDEVRCKNYIMQLLEKLPSSRGQQAQDTK